VVKVVLKKGLFYKDDVRQFNATEDASRFLATEAQDCEVILSRQEFIALVDKSSRGFNDNYQLAQLQQEIQRKDNENFQLKRNYNDVVSRANNEIQKRDRTIEGLKEAVGRWKKKKTKEEGGQLLEESVSEKGVRQVVRTSLPSNLPKKEAYKLLKEHYKDQLVSIRRRANDMCWSAVLEDELQY